MSDEQLYTVQDDSHEPNREQEAVLRQHIAKMEALHPEWKQEEEGLRTELSKK